MPNEPLTQQLNQAHDGLLHIHKALIDYERARYEKVHGRVESPYTLLNLLIEDPWFAWLRPISALIVQIDEFVSSKEPQDPAAGDALLAEIRNILVPNEHGTDFQQKYHRALQEAPDIALLHANWKFSPK
jgi:hypothetical protein